MKKPTKKPAAVESIEIVAEPKTPGEFLPQDQCMYCGDCEGVVNTPPKLPYYGRVVTVCGAGYNPAKRCRKFELLCMEAQHGYIVKKQAEKSTAAA